MLYCDLHTHSTFSDGSDTPEQLVAVAKEAGLSAIALTDHNSVDGLSRFVAAARESGLIAVNGCEFTTALFGRELHIVGLFLPEECRDAVRATVRKRNDLKDRSNMECVKRLRDAGYDISYEQILEIHPAITPNRVHIARALVSKGYVSTISEAFETLLLPKHGFYAEPEQMDSLEIVRSIRSWKGLAIWAHPLLSVERERLPEFLEALTGAGLDGVETRYSTYSAEDEAFMDEIAARYSLYASGGSDYHGVNKPTIMPGSGTGSLCVTREMFEQLEALAVARQAH